MSLRKVPGALGLGLLASLIGHAALYRGQHAAGGNYHVLLLEIALAAAVALVSAGVLLAWSGASRASDGSVLSARLAVRLPGFALLLTSTALWYGTIEHLEPHHADASLVAAGISLTGAAWIVAAIGRWFCALLADAILAIASPAFHPRSLSWFVARYAAPQRRRTPCTHRRFARPPPVGSFIGA